MGFSLEEHVLPYLDVRHHDGSDGYVVWRVGTGRNVELLHIKTDPAAPPGAGRRLLKQMVGQLASNPPYATVFGFTRVGNREAQRFYVDNGFNLTCVEGVYADGRAIVFSQEYRRLADRLGVEG